MVQTCSAPQERLLGPAEQFPRLAGPFLGSSRKSGAEGRTTAASDKLVVAKQRRLPGGLRCPREMVRLGWAGGKATGSRRSTVVRGHRRRSGSFSGAPGRGQQ